MGKKRNPLPDHRAKAYGGTHYRPSEKETLELAKRYRFKPNYPLRDSLEYVYSKEETNSRIAENSSTLGEQKKQLKILRDRCEHVQEVVSKLSTSERILLDEIFSEPLNLHQFEKDAHRIYSASRICLDRLRDQKGSRQKNTNIWNFIFHLADIWQEGTGTNPSIGYSDFNEQYVGKFYGFVLECAMMGSIQLSKADPGGSIVKILTEWRQRN